MSDKFKVLSFDLDDTLWPCAPTIIKAEEVLFEWLSVNVPQITQRFDMHQLRDRRLALMADHPELSHDLTSLRLRSFEQLADELDLPTDWMQGAFDVFYEARQQVDLYEDVAPVLDALVLRYRLVSLTNGNASPEKTGIDHWFEFSLSSIEVGKLKSEPDIYEKVQEIAKIPAHHMVHIGDDPVNDVAGAKSAGIRAVWLNRGRKPWALDDIEPDATIYSLAELPDVLDKI